MAGTHKPTNKASWREPENQRTTDKTSEAKPATRKASLARWNELTAVRGRWFWEVRVAVMGGAFLLSDDQIPHSTRLSLIYFGSAAFLWRTVRWTL